MKRLIVFVLICCMLLAGCNSGSETNNEPIDVASAINDIHSDSEGNIVFELSDGRKYTIDAVKGKDGINGKDGKDGVDGKDGINGKDGKDGIDGKDGSDGKDGVSVKNVVINDNNHLICTLSDNTVIDAGDVSSDIIASLYAEDGYEITIVNEFPQAFLSDSGRYIIITSANCIAHKLNEPICKVGDEYYSTVYYEYEVVLTVNVENKDNSPIYGITFHMLNPFGSDVGTSGGQTVDTVDNDDGTFEYTFKFDVPYVLEGNKVIISGFITH